MGIDIRAGGRYVGHKNRTEPLSENVYVRLITKVRVRFSVVWRAWVDGGRVGWVDVCDAGRRRWRPEVVAFMDGAREIG